MVRVNTKPQHLVFCSHLAHLPSKHCGLAVEKLCAALCDADLSASNVVKAGQSSPATPSLALWPTRNKEQDRCNLLCTAVQMWTNGGQVFAEAGCAQNRAKTHQNVAQNPVLEAI